MFNIQVSQEIRNIAPDFVGVAISADIINNESSDDLWKEIDNYTQVFKSVNTFETIKANPVISATRNAYKTLGKDPNRYRPSAEALCRRVIRGLPLYKINNLVDIINLISLCTGYSIGGFDAGKIEGNTVTLGVGKTGEPFESIGRGMLNIEGLPVYRDEAGGMGTPTSDNDRTKLDLDTTNLLSIFNGYNGREGMTEATDMFLRLLHKYCSCRNEKVIYF